MTKEKVDSPESNKEAWLWTLAFFIVEANQNTWAADEAEVEPERPGHKELEYKNGDWTLRDSYTGYFNAPGVTVVSYKDRPVWTMAYSGGMTIGNEKYAKETFDYLKSALMMVTPLLPYRGPRLHAKDDKLYEFELVGDLEDYYWVENIYLESNINTFTQKGNGGIVVHKDDKGEPLYPWDL